jgi:hypothetical protein
VPAIAVIEAQASGVRLGAGICLDCAARPDCDLIAETFRALQQSAPSLRALGPAGLE